MGIVEVTEVTHVEKEEKIVKRICDICYKEIKLSNDGHFYNYFVIHTWHHDWGNDSVESHDYLDACCPECVIKFTKDYIKNAYESMYNTKEIEISHVRSLEAGAYNE